MKKDLWGEEKVDGVAPERQGVKEEGGPDTAQRAPR